MKISLTTGRAFHYDVGLVSGLLKQNLALDVIGGDVLQRYSGMQQPGVNFKNLYGTDRPDASRWQKALQAVWVYLRIMFYARKADSRLIHIQWPYKFVLFDRTLLNIYYKALGKKLIFTAHNVDGDARDGISSWTKRASLQFSYRMMDHIIVHTNRMKYELMNDFGVPDEKISVIPHGLMSAVPETVLSKAEARKQIGVDANQRVLLFFGMIAPYKGLEIVIEAMGRLRSQGKTFTLIIAGRIKECPDYWEKLRRLIDHLELKEYVKTDLRRIPDEFVEVYLKAADVMVLPYRNIFQSGVLFLAYRFGLPVIATDVGSFREDIVPGQTGFVCRADDPTDMANAIETYFSSDLFTNLETRSRDIRDYANKRYSWEHIGELTRHVYERVLQQ